MLIRAHDSVLVVIDMQERLVPAMMAPARTIRNARTLLQAAEKIGIPTLLTENILGGLGPPFQRLNQSLAHLRYCRRCTFPAWKILALLRHLNH